MKLKVVIEKGEDGYYVVTVPSLPGCISQGKTKEEALENIKEAIELYLEVLQEKELKKLKKAEIAEVII
ncbi:type II toxin-antitoxin system HicB family antitoxin [Archaeoglobales archaeon]|nr:MAG: HicB family protein [Archaeoglobales archaeon ex4484_92]RLI83752.1 MAG: type II toxin-antitoxin system HicB family antitoxin [Archaeoglobales archaeon]